MLYSLFTQSSHQKKGESNFKILKHNSLLRPNSTSLRTSTHFEELLIPTHYNNSIIAHKETNINIGSKCYTEIYYISGQSVRVKEKKNNFSHSKGFVLCGRVVIEL